MNALLTEKLAASIFMATYTQTHTLQQGITKYIVSLPATAPDIKWSYKALKLSDPELHCSYT
jgi:hypothetical protein